MTAATLLLQAAALPSSPCPAEQVGHARVYEGVYLDEFEAQRFVAGARTLADARAVRTPTIWLSFDVVAQGARFGVTRRAYNGAYRVRFVGVARTRGSARLECGYGHLGTSASEVTLTRLLAIEPLGPPQR